MQDLRLTAEGDEVGENLNGKRSRMNLPACRIGNVGCECERGSNVGR